MDTRKGLRQVITCFPLAASILFLTGGALARPSQPDISEEGNLILIQNDHARLILSKDGQTKALLDKKTGTDYLDHSIPVHFMTARRGNVEYGSSGLARAGNVFTVEFGGSGIVASVRIGAKRAYFTIEVVSISQKTLDELIIVDLPLTISERVARVQEKREHSETINVGRNDDFGISVMSVNLNTESKTVRYEPAAFRSTCYPRFGLEGAKAAIVAGPADQILEIIGQIELELGMAHPTLGGQWGKISEEVKKSYLFVDFTEENIERAIALAQAGGFGQILNYRSVWAISSGKYEVNRKNFPHGLEGLKGVMHRIHEAGLKGGVHMMSGGISKNDGYVTPLPDPRLAKDDMRVLAADISEAATTLPLTTSPEGLPAQELYAESGMSLVIRVKARPSRAGFGQGENIVLARGDSSGLWMGETAGSDFTLSMTPSAEQVKVGAGSLKLTAENRAGESSSWAAQTLVFKQPLDLSKNRALGVWVHGDGSGAAFNIRLKSGGFSRDHLIKLDFRGWKYCEWAEPSGGVILDYSLPGYPLRSLRSFNYRKVESITLFITDVSPHSRVTAYLGRVEALRERPSTVKNPALVVNSERIVFPVTLQNNHYLEYWGNGEVTVYDENGHTIESTRPLGKPPTMRAGSNRVAYRSESPSGEPEQARVEIITIGPALRNP